MPEAIEIVAAEPGVVALIETGTPLTPFTFQFVMVVVVPLVKTTVFGPETFSVLIVLAFALNVNEPLPPGISVIVPNVPLPFPVPELSDLVDDEASLITIVELAIEQVEFAPPLFQIVPVPVSVTMLVPSVRDRTLELFEE